MGELLKIIAIDDNNSTPFVIDILTDDRNSTDDLRRHSEITTLRHSRQRVYRPVT